MHRLLGRVGLVLIDYPEPRRLRDHSAGGGGAGERVRRARPGRSPARSPRARGAAGPPGACLGRWRPGVAGLFRARRGRTIGKMG